MKEKKEESKQASEHEGYFWCDRNVPISLQELKITQVYTW